MAKKNQNENITPKNPIIVQSMDDVMHSSMMPYAEHADLRIEKKTDIPDFICKNRKYKRFS